MITKQKQKLKKGKHYKVYKHINSIGFNNVKIVLINEFYLENKDQLRREENNYIEMYKHDPNCLNSVRSFLSDETKKY